MTTSLPATELMSSYKQTYRTLHTSHLFSDYLDIVRRDPLVCRTAFQRAYDMVMSYGTEEIDPKHKDRVKYSFFTRPENGPDQIFGLYDPLRDLVRLFQSASLERGTERRIILLHGPVGSSKSTIARLLKRGLERYSAAPDGAFYSHRWKASAYYGSDQLAAVASPGGGDWVKCPMHENPLKLIPKEIRARMLSFLGIERVEVDGDLCPACRAVFSRLLDKYDGDFMRLVEDNVQIYRLLLSEQDRVGIGTFQPKDEKNQDSTDLTGDINYRKIAYFGDSSDARAFDFNGEFNVANRGMIEFIEMLKLDVAFLYDLLGVSQEHAIKPKRFAQVDVDTVIIGHTNGPEYERLMKNEFMEALRDRTVKVDVPYLVKWGHEIEVHRRGRGTMSGCHFAPHAIEMASGWATLTRLEDPKNHGLTLLQKLKLYNGKSLPGFTLDAIEQLRKESKNEGMSGISPRYIQDKIANASVLQLDDSGCINAFMLLHELETGLKHHSLIPDEERRKRYTELIQVMKDEYTDIVKNEVQRAISFDEDGLSRVAGNYIENVKAYTQREKVKNPFTGQMEEPDERLMRSIEERIDITDSRKDDFRREVMNYIGALALDGKSFDFRKNERLLKAVELKLFDDSKDTIRLTTLVTNTVDRETQAKIDIVTDRLIREYGYLPCCAHSTLQYVASVFARGDAKKDTKK